MQNLNAFSLKNSVALDFVFFFLGGGYIWKEDNWKKLSEKMSMLKKIICLGISRHAMVLVIRYQVLMNLNQVHQHFLRVRRFSSNRQIRWFSRMDLQVLRR